MAKLESRPRLWAPNIFELPWKLQRRSMSEIVGSDHRLAYLERPAVACNVESLIIPRIGRGARPKPNRKQRP